jgi:hypothetical protein
MNRAKARNRLSVGIDGKCVADVTVWLAKLGVVECVKELHPELQLDCLRDRGVFQQRDIPVVKPGPAKNLRLAFPNWPRGSRLNSEGSKNGFVPERTSLICSGPGV